MTEQTEQFNPSDHNVDDVNAYLETASDDERARVLQAETEGQSRKGILEGTHAVKVAPEDQDGGAPKVTETKAATFKEAAKAASEPEGEAYQKGYMGYAPSRDGKDPVDLTLAGVTGQKDA